MGCIYWFGLSLELSSSIFEQVYPDDLHLGFSDIEINTVVSEIKFNKCREPTAGGALTFNRA